MVPLSYLNNALEARPAVLGGQAMKIVRTSVTPLCIALFAAACASPAPQDDRSGGSEKGGTADKSAGAAGTQRGGSSGNSVGSDRSDKGGSAGIAAGDPGGSGGNSISGAAGGTAKAGGT